ncbi:MAG: hypothetical protein IJW83_00165 [Clostridia bacterium]|nr:hypothetical protein [Clostridia bacterium]
MIENDTIKLLRECDAGVKMGVSSIEDVLGHVRSDELKQLLSKSKDHHECLSSDIEELLTRYHDDGKDPSFMAKGMSHMKSSMKLMMDPTDAAIADLMTDGCNMGVKSLSRYLNQYAAADEQSKDIAKKLIRIEDDLSVDMRGFL